MQPGQLVSVRDECWTIARAETFNGGLEPTARRTVVSLEGRGPANMGRRLQVVAPFDEVRGIETGKPKLRKRHAVLRAALAAIAHERPALGLWTAAGASLDLLSYQLEPTLAVLRGATRVLLADGVGLGKTIQAGLILSELRARSLVDRALIVCPAGLRGSWLAELRDRFGIPAVVLDHAAIAAGLAGTAGLNPWATQPVVIASIDFVKRPEVLAAAEAAAVDLIVADEAHHLTPGSDRGRAVERLALRAPWLVLLSATPHSGDQPAFEYLTGIGSLGDALTTFRRTRRDVGLPAGRRSHLLPIVPTDEEERLLQATTAYARAIWQARGQSDRAVQLVAITLARRAASSAMAVGRTLARRRELLADESLAVPEQFVLPWDDVDDRDGDEQDSALACPGLIDRPAELRELDAIIDLARHAAARSSKLHRLRRLLARAGEPAVVFTEYRDTLNAAIEALTGAFRLGSIHGGVPATMRQQVVQQFQQGELDVLVATDTAGEGLNLHQRCRLVIDLELPWNPLRLEQRVGRVDRLGQRRRVHAVHLMHRGTVEDTVWRHLEDRRQRADRALEEWSPVTDDDVARAVFGNGVLPMACGAPIVSTHVVESAAEAGRVAVQRRLRAHAERLSARPVFARPRRRGVMNDQAVALVEYTRLGPLGGMIERSVLGFLVSLEGQADEVWRQAAARVGAHVDRGPQPEWPAREALLARIAAARTRLTEAPALHQASLFDRRAELAAGARREVATRVDATLARRAESVTLSSPLTCDQRLIAFWPRRR